MLLLISQYDISYREISIIYSDIQVVFYHDSEYTKTIAIANTITIIVQPLHSYIQSMVSMCKFDQLNFLK